MSTSEWPDLSATARAIEDLDREEPHLVARLEEATGPEEVERALRDLEEARAQVGTAFAFDTRDRNDPATAARARAGPWLRGLVERWERSRR